MDIGNRNCICWTRQGCRTHEIMATLMACTIPAQDQAVQITAWMEEGLGRPHPIAEKLFAVDGCLGMESMFLSGTWLLKVAGDPVDGLHPCTYSQH